MDIFDSSYYRINKWLLWYSGLWPYQSRTIKLLTFALATFGISSFLIPQVIYILKFLNNLDNLLASMPTCAGGILMVMKFLSLACKRTEMRCILDEVRENWSTYRTGRELKILQDYANMGRRFTLGYELFGIPPILIFSLYPLSAPILDVIVPLNVSRPRILPHPGEFFVDQEKYFYLLMLIECFSYAMAIIITIGSDTMYIILIQHCCGLFRILRYSLEDLSTQEMDSMKSTMSRSEAAQLGYPQILRCIRLHVKTKKFAQLISSIFTTFLSVDIILGIVMHSTASVMIVIYMNEPEYVVKFGGVLITQSLRLFLNSWPGQELMDHSAKIATAAYSGTWYRMSAKAKKLLLILIMDGQNPCTVTIAKIYVVNLGSFGMIMRTSLSYCTVMASLHDSSTL